MKSFKKLKLLDTSVDDKFKSTIKDNLSSVKDIVSSRDGFYAVCEKLVNSGAFKGVSAKDIQAMLEAIKQAEIFLPSAKAMLESLRQEMQDYMKVESLVLEEPKQADYSEILTADYNDMIAMLKTYMYGSHAKEKSALKSAKTIFNNRVLVQKTMTDDVVDHMYQNSVNYNYIVALNEILAKAGSYRSISEGLIRMAKASQKSNSQSMDIN
ncbi:MAG: hypothetical protein IJW28_01385 [Clostridia bacterium]|nr:hypothetical protein [Clostridia bacterium]